MSDGRTICTRRKRRLPLEQQEFFCNSEETQSPHPGEPSRIQLKTSGKQQLYTGWFHDFWTDLTPESSLDIWLNDYKKYSAQGTPGWSDDFFYCNIRYLPESLKKSVKHWHVFGCLLFCFRFNDSCNKLGSSCDAFLIKKEAFIIHRNPRDEGFIGI